MSAPCGMTSSLATRQRQNPVVTIEIVTHVEQNVKKKEVHTDVYRFKNGERENIQQLHILFSCISTHQRDHLACLDFLIK
jgi:hypothetical protein